MGSTQTTRCQTCQAVVNPAWESCAACRKPLIPDWDTEYRRLADLTATLEPGDPHFPALMQTFDRCDEAFARGDVAGFKVAARQVETILSEPTPQGRQASPEPPLQAGWMIAYRDRRNRLQDGTVSRCELGEKGWTVYLVNGTTIPLRSVTSIGVHGGAAWEVKRHGSTETGRRLDENQSIQTDSISARREENRGAPASVDLDTGRARQGADP
ncbi:hypothetical protein ACYX34_15220 [Nitrospira sp. CMX1]